MERVGWQLEVEPQSDEFRMYVHPLKPGRRTLVNPDWPAVYKDDPIFESIRDQMGVSARRLLELLSEHY